MGCSMEGLSHPAANHHVSRVLLDTHLPGHGITERSAQRPDQPGFALGDGDQGESWAVER